MPKVKYVGQKPAKKDNVAMTGTIWNGNGDIQEVSDAAWEKLKNHPDIWELVKAEPSLSDAINEPVAIADIVRKKPGPKPKVTE